jgi:hypothetical protein
VKEKSKWLRRAEAKFERDARREERNKRRAVEDAKLEGDVRHALEVMRDLLLAEERYARLAPKDEEPAKPKRAPDADLVGAPKAVAGETAQWRHETLRWVDLSLRSYYWGKIYASNADGTYAPLHGAMSHDPRGRSPGKPNNLVYQRLVAGCGGRTMETIPPPSETYLGIGRAAVFGRALPVDYVAEFARLDEMVKADRDLVAACLEKDDGGTSYRDAPGIGVADGLDREIAR